MEVCRKKDYIFLIDLYLSIMGCQGQSGLVVSIEALEGGEKHQVGIYSS